MSLATRCTACGTAFRVIQDQLKVSEGWVRCGRCSEVFNALEGLFDLEREPVAEGPFDERRELQAASALAVRPPAGAGEAMAGIGSAALLPMHGPAAGSADRGLPPTSAGPEGPEPDADIGAEDSEAGDSTSLDAEIDAHLFGERPAALRRAPSSSLDERDRLDFSDARFDSDLMGDDDRPAADGDSATGPLGGLAFAPETPSAPDFLRRAERRAQWQRPRVRAVLAVATGLLLGSLVMQVTHHFRDGAAAHWPLLRPAIVGWCALAACTLEAPRRIEDISVESTALTRVPGLDGFRLAVTLRSHGPVRLAMPWIDLSLTDSAGKLVARKALAASQLEPRVAVLQPGAEVAVQALLNTGASRITGYTVEIFYP